MNQAQYIQPGVIQVTHIGPCVEDDDEKWLRKLYQDIGLNEDGTKRECVADVNGSTG